MRSKKLLWNTVSSLIHQVTAIICGFILPRLILGNFGSEINGLVTSITQFLSVVAFLEMGVGAVVGSALYKPLAKNDTGTISRIIISANKFFRRIAGILAGYIIVLCIVYPLLGGNNFDSLFTSGLIVAIGISSFSQYYFGLVDRLLIIADQRGYIFYISQACTVIINTLACAILIHFNASILTVKLVTSIIYLLRPIYIRIYINRHYNIDRKLQLTTEPIPQKWNGVAQHIATVILNNTDTVVLTIMSSLENVSIYSVYYLVVHGVKQLFLSMTNGVQALMGELLAKKEVDTLNKLFQQTEWVIHTGTVFVFGCTAVLMVPFVEIYTLGITDARYIQPMFGLLLTLAHGGHCLRLPYNLLILASGHYKQTQSNYIISALINVIVSVVSVKLWGLIGVAIGTLIAMFYQTFWMAKYTSRNLISWPFKYFTKQMLVDILTFIVAYIPSMYLHMQNVNYLSWVLLAFQVVIIWGGAVIIINSIFYHSNLKLVTERAFAKLRLKHKHNKV